MHEVDDFILPVITRFQNRASLGQTPDTAPIERAVLQQSSPQPPSQREQTLHNRVMDGTKLPVAAQSARGNRKTHPEISKMNSPCDVQQLHTPVHAATRDDSILPDVAQSSRGGTKTPLDISIMDPPGPSLQAAAHRYTGMQHRYHRPAMQGPRPCALTIYCMRMTYRLYTEYRYLIRHGIMIILIRRSAMMELWIRIPYLSLIHI